MRYENISGEFLNDLQGILNINIPNVDPNIIDNIKSDSEEALTKILVKYKLI